MSATYTNTITNSSSPILKSPLRLQSRPVLYSKENSSIMLQSGEETNAAGNSNRATPLKRKAVEMADSEDESDVSLPRVNGISAGSFTSNGSKKLTKKFKLNGKAPKYTVHDLLRQRKELPIWTGVLLLAFSGSSTYVISFFSLTRSRNTS